MPLSHGAMRVLREIVAVTDREQRPATLADLEHLESMVTLLNRIHTLADRWLITVDGKSIRPRQSARRLLSQPRH